MIPTKDRGRLLAPTGEQRHNKFQPEIQGLRAVAVMLVVGYHLFPSRLTGGYIGVDVFFVISGYLITDHLLREVAQTGRLSVFRFWARRVRRLLPASLLVLSVCTALTALVVPATLWDRSIRELVASTFYVQNWALARDAVGYSAVNNVPTLVQHYWTLSTEEQFYFVWPLMVAIGAFAVRPKSVRLGLTILIVCVAAASLAYSVVATSHNPDAAYFVTPTRVWEFAAGGLLALSHPRISLVAARAAVGWIGLAAILSAGLMLDGDTPFPGWIALVPVLGTAAVIAAGTSHSKMAAAYWLSRRPATWVGDISYSIYLWHWPILVALPYATGHNLTTFEKLAVFVATLLLSWLSTRLVEEPIRRSKALSEKPLRTIILGACGMAVVIAGVLLLRADLANKIDASTERTQAALAAPKTTGCLGPPSIVPANNCSTVHGTGALLSPPVAVAAQLTRDKLYTTCFSPLNSAVIRSCHLGDNVEPDRRVALVGDSHATHWGHAFDTVGKEQNWEITTYFRPSCPLTAARRVLPAERTSAEQFVCERSNSEVVRRILADPKIDTVFVSARSSVYEWISPPALPLADPAHDGFRRLWGQLVGAGKQVVVLRDVPQLTENVPSCVEGRTRPPWLRCASPVAKGLVADVEAEAAVGQSGVSVVDLSDLFCDTRWCYPVIGDVLVYFDSSHISAEYSTLLAPFLSRAISEIGR